jgi:hypothetical protein
MPDHIDHPVHYTQGIECIDYILSHNMDYLEGNIIKYVTRYKFKGGVDDLRKAEWYLKQLLKREAIGPALTTAKARPTPEECAKPLTDAGFLCALQNEHRDEVINETREAMCEASREHCSNFIKPHKWCKSG